MTGTLLEHYRTERMPGAGFMPPGPDEPAGRRREKCRAPNGTRHLKVDPAGGPVRPDRYLDGGAATAGVAATGAATTGAGCQK